MDNIFHNKQQAKQKSTVANDDLLKLLFSQVQFNHWGKYLTILV